MKVLIIFETVEGQTRKIVEAIEDQVRSSGHDVQLFDTRDKLAALSFEGIHKVVLAAPIHERRHPAGFEVLIGASLDDLKGCDTFLISVSLKAAFPEGMEEAQDYLVEMAMRTGFEPDREMLLAGAVRTASYGYFETQIVQNVALEGRKIDLVDGVCEFTDWDALRTELNEFLTR